MERDAIRACLNVPFDPFPVKTNHCQALTARVRPADCKLNNDDICNVCDQETFRHQSSFAANEAAAGE